MRFSLEKEEKLKRRKLIEQLFSEGDSVKSYPFHMVFLPVNRDDNAKVQVGFSVPKRNIKLAVNRNRIKRLMREVYRKNKHLFSDNLNQKYIFMLVYVAKNEINYTELELAITQLATKFQLKIKRDEN